LYFHNVKKTTASKLGAVAGFISGNEHVCDKSVCSSCVLTYALCWWQPSRLRDKTLVLNVESYMYVVRTSIQADMGACIMRVKILAYVEKSSANSFQFVFQIIDIKKF